MVLRAWAEFCRDVGVLGSALGMTISYTAYHSIGWAVAAGCFSWFYVIYKVMV